MRDVGRRRIRIYALSHCDDAGDHGLRRAGDYRYGFFPLSAVMIIMLALLDDV
jgi:hypothetical protein